MNKILMACVLYSIIVFPVAADEFDFPVKKELDMYRDLKSKEFAVTGQKITPAIKENWSKYFRSFGNDSDKVIYILHDTYSLVSVDTGITEVDFTPKGEVFGDEYIIKIEETIIGKIDGNRIVYLERPSRFQLIYVYDITPDGPKLASEDGFRRYYILEKDVPLLLERIQERN
jgi:hypothetical protein